MEDAFIVQECRMGRNRERVIRERVMGHENNRIGKQRINQYISAVF